MEFAASAPQIMWSQQAEPALQMASWADEDRSHEHSHGHMGLDQRSISSHPVGFLNLLPSSSFIHISRIPVLEEEVDN